MQKKRQLQRGGVFRVKEKLPCLGVAFGVMFSILYIVQGGSRLSEANRKLVGEPFI